VESLISFIQDNKQWLLSGILVPPIVWIFNTFSLANLLKPTGPNISGRWLLKYPANGEGYAEFKQFRNRIRGKIVVYKTDSGKSTDRSFDISGWFMSGKLTATFEDTESRGVGVGVVALKLFHDRTRMNGIVLVFGEEGGKTVIDYNITLQRNTA
jgi:hypothetical protein